MPDDVGGFVCLRTRLCVCYTESMNFLHRHQHPVLLARWMAALLFVAVLAGEWDVWWHVTVGRDAFFEPPHIMLYGSLLLAMALGIFGWRKTREKVWVRIAGILVFMPLVVLPLDELWHGWFGVENLTSPLIIWSLPHVLLILAMAGSLILTLPLIGKDPNAEARRIFGGSVFAAVLSLAMILAIPTNPIGAYHVLGFWGTILGGFFITLAFLSSSRWLGGFAPATLFAAFFLVLYLAGVREKVGEGIIIPPHSTFPPWIVVFGYLLAALWTDVSTKYPTLARGIVAAIIWSAVLYGTTAFFISDPELQYGFGKTLIAVFSASVGGLIASMCYVKMTGER